MHGRALSTAVQTERNEPPFHGMNLPAGKGMRESNDIAWMAVGCDILFFQGLEEF